MTVTHTFAQTLFFAPQDRPEGQTFDVDFSYLFNQYVPWLEKYVEGLLGIEGFRIIRGFDTSTFKTSHHAAQTFKFSIEEIEVSNAVTTFSFWVFDAAGFKHQLENRKAFHRPRPLWIKAPFTIPEQPPILKTHFKSLEELNNTPLESEKQVPQTAPTFKQTPVAKTWSISDQRYKTIRDKAVSSKGNLTPLGFSQILGVEIWALSRLFAGQEISDMDFLRLEEALKAYKPKAPQVSTKTEAEGYSTNSPLYKELQNFAKSLVVTQKAATSGVNCWSNVLSLAKAGNRIPFEMASELVAHFRKHPEFFKQDNSTKDIFEKVLETSVEKQEENPWEDIQTKFDLISKSSFVVAELVGYPLATITGIREGTLTEVNEAHYKALNNKVAEVLEKKAKGQLKIPTGVAVIEPVKAPVTMPKFPEAVVKTDREIRDDQQKKEIFVGMAKEVKEIIAGLSAYTGSSICEYLAINAQFFGRLKAGTTSITAFPQLRSVLQKLKNVSNPDDIFVRKEDLIAKKREVLLEIKSLLSKPWGMSQAEVSTLAGFAPKHIANLTNTAAFSYNLESYEELRDVLKKLAVELLDNKPVKAPEMAPAPMPVKVKEKPVKAKALSDIKNVVKPAMVENIHRSGIRIPKFDEKTLATRAKETLKGYRGNSSVVSRTVHHECFMRNRQRFMIISKHIEEVAKLTGIHQNLVKRAFNHNNPPSSQEQVMIFLYLTDIKSTLTEIEAFNEANA